MFVNGDSSRTLAMTEMQSALFSRARNPGDVLETFNFLENADDSDEDEDEEGDMMEDISDREKHRIKKHKIKVNKPPLSLSQLKSTWLLDRFAVWQRDWTRLLCLVALLLMCGQEMAREGLTLSQQSASLKALTFAASKQFVSRFPNDGQLATVLPVKHSHKRSAPLCESKWEISVLLVLHNTFMPYIIVQ